MIDNYTFLATERSLSIYDSYQSIVVNLGRNLAVIMKRLLLVASVYVNACHKKRLLHFNL